MDEKEKDLKPEKSDFSLEDILREFGDFGPDEPEEDVQIWGEEKPNKPKKETAVPSDTVRLDQISRAVRQMEETPAVEQTQRFTPVGGEPEEEAVDVLIPEEPRAEPYSDEWEPEYEQPIGEYVVQEPIVFRPKSRLGELKRKLIEGPEKRYYELCEQGLGRLQAAMIANFAVALLAGGITVMFSLGILGEERVKLVCFCQFLSLLLSALLGSYQLMEGFMDMVKRRFSLNSLLLFSLIVCLADGILCLQEVRVPCCATFSLAMTMSLWGTYHKRSIEMGQMDTMRKATQLDSVVSVADYYEGRPGFLRSKGQVEDFMDTYREPSREEKALSIYALVALFVSVAIGVTAGILHSVSLGVQAASAALLVAAPCTMFITLTRPMAILEKRLHQLGTVLCGWQGVTQLSRTGVFPLDHEDLFPAGSAKLNGVKFYGTRSPDEVVAYASAVICARGGTLAPLFHQLLESRNGYHYDIEELRSYPDGIGAVIQEEAVLAGTLTFMKSMGVEIPAGTRVSQAVYLAIDGELSGVFAITFYKDKSSISGMHTLCAYRRIRPVMVTEDFMLSEGFLRGRFHCNIRRIAFPEVEVRRELAEKKPDEHEVALALTTRDGLAPAAYAVTGARALRSASVAGTAVHLLGGILGLVMMAVLAVLGAAYLLTPVNVLLYGLIWMIPGLLITEWTRSI